MKLTRFLSLLLLGIALATYVYLDGSHTLAETHTPKLWQFQSIDTMKYSRDTSREKLHDSSFDAVIEDQIRKIADTGATHVGIATPYDEEFLPFLKRWVAAARRNNLSVWFRGNWSGWEEWFDYPKITREEHISKTIDFILNNPQLFMDGDVFSGCPECENGGPGNPQIVGDVTGYRAFLINEYKATKTAFAKIGKRVASNYFSMNGDVARLIMDKETTAAVDGIVTVDHYVRTPQRLVSDIQSLAERSGGKVVLGEFGAPIPDIHGNMSEEEQRRYLELTFEAIAKVPELIGVNYWVNVGGSTRLWNDDGSKRSSVDVVTNYFTPTAITGRVVDEFGEPITSAVVTTSERMTMTNSIGEYQLVILKDPQELEVTSKAYKTVSMVVSKTDELPVITLVPLRESWWYRIRKFFYQTILGR